MFASLSKNLTSILEKLTKKGIVTENDVNHTLREVRLSLLEADVALEVVKEFVEKIRVKATGHSVIKSVTPGQQVIKIVHDELIDLLSVNRESEQKLKIDSPPASVLMIGLQGSGKTTTTSKLAKLLKEKNKKKVLMASLDTRRPAAMDQLKILGEQNQIDVLEIVPNQKPVDIASRAKQQATLGGYDVFILDTAGRTHVDKNLMDEIAQVKSKINPNETLLVVDGLTGQDAVHVAKEFDATCKLDGIIVTKLDGDSRGGAALSMRAITQKPIKFIGVGEKSNELEVFEPKRIADRILGMGDIISLVEKAQEQLDAEKTQRMIKRLEKGYFNMNDLRLQLEQTIKMGGMQGMLGMIPGLGKISKQLEKANLDDKILSRQIALITSMTKRERSNPQILQASRKKRIAIGAGQEVSDLNKLIKMHRQMADVMKKIGRKGNRGMLRDLIGNLTGNSGSKEKLTDLVDQNAALRNPLQNNLGSKDLTRMMGGIPDFMKKN
jgi:signal recognition particle subunit SRP54